MECMKRNAPRSSGYGPALWLALVLVVALSGCGLFNPEDPPPPSGSSGIHRPNLQTPDSALYCIIVGIAAKSPQLYEFALPDTVQDGANFHAFFDPQDLIDYAQTGTTPPTDWTTPDEQRFIGQYTTLVPVASYDVALANDQNRSDFLGPDETIYYRHYRVSFGSPPQFLGVGLADLYFRRVGVNQDWKLIRWVDRRDTTVFSVRTIGRQRLGPPSVNP
jgi:hypothetical protein